MKRILWIAILLALSGRTARADWPIALTNITPGTSYTNLLLEMYFKGVNKRRIAAGLAPLSEEKTFWVYEGVSNSLSIYTNVVGGVTNVLTFTNQHRIYAQRTTTNWDSFVSSYTNDGDVFFVTNYVGLTILAVADTAIPVESFVNHFAADTNGYFTDWFAVTGRATPPMMTWTGLLTDLQVGFVTSRIASITTNWHWPYEVTTNYQTYYGFIQMPAVTQEWTLADIHYAPTNWTYRGTNFFEGTNRIVEFEGTYVCTGRSIGGTTRWYENGSVRATMSFSNAVSLTPHWVSLYGGPTPPPSWAGPPGGPYVYGTNAMTGFISLGDPIWGWKWVKRATLATYHTAEGPPCLECSEDTGASAVFYGSRISDLFGNTTTAGVESVSLAPGAVTSLWWEITNITVSGGAGGTNAMWCRLIYTNVFGQHQGWGSLLTAEALLERLQVVDALTQTYSKDTFYSTDYSAEDTAEASDEEITGRWDDQYLGSAWMALLSNAYESLTLSYTSTNAFSAPRAESGYSAGVCPIECCGEDGEFTGLVANASAAGFYCTSHPADTFDGTNNAGLLEAAGAYITVYGKNSFVYAPDLPEGSYWKCEDLSPGSWPTTNDNTETYSLLYAKQPPAFASLNGTFVLFHPTAYDALGTPALKGDLIPCWTGGELCSYHLKETMDWGLSVISIIEWDFEYSTPGP